jgi:ParB-like chromosome segregation protein Spo0J
MDYLITWNQKHIFNLDRIESLYAAIRQRGYAPPVLARPDYLLEASHGA